MNTLSFMNKDAEVMRIGKDGVWINPDIPPDEVARTVLETMALHTRSYYQHGRESLAEEIRAKVAEMTL
jgi:hypothetical protein